VHNDDHSMLLITKEIAQPLELDDAKHCIYLQVDCRWPQRTSENDNYKTRLSLLILGG
jgi:hypothetical protein